MRKQYGRWTILALLVSAGQGVPGYAAEEGTVKATSAWQGQGRFFQVGKDQAFFVGDFEGIMYVETKTGALDAAKIICPGTVDLNLKTGTQSGQGRCVITAANGDQVFATWNCTGTHTAGCAGMFTLTDGTGRFNGIVGNGEFQVRSSLSDYATTAGSGSVQATSTGLATWSALTYKIP
jgi:hypothetical protein